MMDKNREIQAGRNLQYHQLYYHQEVNVPSRQCLLGKGKKLPYPKGKHISKAPLDYAHADLWGPAKTASMGGGKFFLSMVDDYSRKVWLYMLRHKSDAFKCFKDWCAEMENQKRVNLKCLRTDNGLEFLSKEFSEFCKRKGIKRHRSVPGNPQQNGVVERMNRTLLERMRCMLLYSGLLENSHQREDDTKYYPRLFVRPILLENDSVQ